MPINNFHIVESVTADGAGDGVIIQSTTAHEAQTISHASVGAYTENHTTDFDLAGLFLINILHFSPFSIT